LQEAAPTLSAVAFGKPGTTNLLRIAWVEE
jgi:hypothetical protein